MQTFKFNNNEYKIYYNPYDTSGYGSLREISVNNDYLLDKFKDTKGGHFIDIGANCGVATIILAKQNPESVVYSFEPHFATFKVLEENVRLNDLLNVKLYNRAVTKPGIKTLKLAVYPAMTGANSTCANIEEFKKTYTNSAVQDVECISFDEIINENNIKEINLLKIDCEGAEFDILYNTEHFKNRIVKNMVGEFHDLKYNIADNKSALLREFCKKYVDGLCKLSILTL